MATRLLILEPKEADANPGTPGSKRVRPVASADERRESSTQVRLRTRAGASACGTSWPGPAHKLVLLAASPGLGHWPELPALGTGSEK
eukprot:scaffold5696_cov119-Isochrysis_galbana.AAC.18